MTEDQQPYNGPERRNCSDHLNCIYRIELLEKAHQTIWKKIDYITKLLIANLAGICTLLLSALIGAVVWIGKTH